MDSSIETEETAAGWLARRGSGEWSDADEAELAQWLQESVANRVAFMRLEAAWQQAGRLKALGSGMSPGVVPSPGSWSASPFFEMKGARAEEPLRGEALPRGTPVTSGRRFVRLHGLAASVMLAIGAAAVWYFWPHGSTYATPVGGLAAVPMPDGSKVTLNTDSEIRVAVTETERLVELERGEAFFEVAKELTRPFVVAAGDRRVVAIGTKFSVRTEEEGSGEVRVVVTEGRVRLASAASGVAARQVPPAEISAGGIARSGGAGVLIRKGTVRDAEQILSWRSGYLIFRDTVLADAVAEFNRYNTQKIVIEDAEVAGIRIGGNFRSTNADAFVRLLEDGFPIRVEQSENRIVLTNK